jgi:predicted nucleotidyltransferase
MADLLQPVQESGFPLIDRLIHLFVVGSELHGAKVQGTDDLDIYGLYVEPPEMAVGLDSRPHFVSSTAGNERRNGPKDVDVTLYSLKKWAGLACKGNPTALHFLFTKSALRNKIWSEILEQKDAFLSRSCVPQFLPLRRCTMKRMTGKLGRGKKGQRPEMEEKYGYDVKAGMHVLRLLYECQELVSTGNIPLPRPERDLLIQARTGKFTMEKVLAMSQRLFAECEEAAHHSSLPEKVDRAVISKLLAKAYREAWDASI